jgi:hypothetical protein
MYGFWEAAVAYAYAYWQVLQRLKRLTLTGKASETVAVDHAEILAGYILNIHVSKATATVKYRWQRKGKWFVPYHSFHDKFLMMYARQWILWTIFSSDCTDIFSCSNVWLRPVVVDVWMSDYNFESVLGAFEWYLVQGGSNLGLWLAGWCVVAHKPHSARHETVWPTEGIASPIFTIGISWRWVGQLHDEADEHQYGRFDIPRILISWLIDAIVCGPWV